MTSDNFKERCARKKTIVSPREDLETIQQSASDLAVEHKLDLRNAVKEGKLAERRHFKHLLKRDRSSSHAMQSRMDDVVLDKIASVLCVMALIVLHLLCTARVQNVTDRAIAAERMLR